MKDKIKKALIKDALSYEYQYLLYLFLAVLAMLLGDSSSCLIFLAITWIIKLIIIIQDKELGVNFNGPVTVNHKSVEKNDE